MNSQLENYDVCVIGGGPGGSTAATFLAMRGHKVLLIEKETLPIYKIGESLLPATIHGICGMLGLTEELKTQNFVRKLGGTFRWGRAKEPWTFAFAESSRFQGPTSYAYQVERIKFDTILLDNAKKNGVDVRERHRARALIFDADRVAGLVFEDDLGNQTSVQTRYVVDASGHTSAIARYAGERVFSPFFQNLAVFGYFINGGRLPQPNSGNIFSVAFGKGWFWYIPLSETLTSVGAVIGQEYADVLHGGHEIALSELIGECQPVKNLLASAVRCTDPPYDKVRVRKDYSYSNTRFWRQGLVLIGDAACFIDPVFSSGVHLATYSALLAARSINTYLGNYMDEAIAFKEFEDRYRREFNIFCDFLTAFYDLDQDLESYYWSARKAMNTEDSGHQAFVNLVGGMASGDFLNGRADPGGRRALGNVLFPPATGATADMYVESGHHSTERKQFWAELNKENFRLQLRGTFKAGSADEQPLFLDGLVPSTDGLHWVRAAGKRKAP